jgi:hypothetical protein
LKRYFYSLLARYITLFARPGDSLAWVDPLGTDETQAIAGGKSVSVETLESGADFDYLVLNGNLHYERDVQTYLTRIHRGISAKTRLIIVYYSALWRPFLRLATAMGWRSKTAEQNWLSHSDVINFLALSDFDVVRIEPKVLLPVHIPLISNLLNRYVAPLPFFSLFCFVNVLVARPRRVTGELTGEAGHRPSVSVVVPARNEAGNIESIVSRMPVMGPQDELIFIEGGSKDDTWQRIREVRERFGHERRIVIAQQDGKGKGDAVRKGFGLATCEILMILDADLTVPPEDLPKFYDAIVRNKGEFINGSRLVYPMEKRAMRFLNLLANKFFAVAFSFVLAQRFKDTLCGTKVLTRANYERLARNRSYFGEFDPFGDFDLIFGAARMGLRIVEVPITYRERTYGETNISRWTHGTLLLAMLLFAARRLKFI